MTDLNALADWLDETRRRCIDAVEYVGFAHYSERIAEAQTQVRNAFDDFRAAAQSVAPTPSEREIVALKEALAAANARADEAYERCARVAEEKSMEFLSPEYASGQPLSSFSERFACRQVAAAIRALHPGRGN